MSQTRYRVAYDGVNSKEAIDQIEQGLKRLDTVEIHTLGLNLVDLSFDQHTVKRADIERVVSEAGGTVRNMHPE